MRKKTSRKKYSDSKSFVFLVLAFLAFGLLMIADSTSISSNNLYGDPYRFVFLQATWAAVGLVFFYIFYHLDYRSLMRISRSLFIFNLLALVALAIIGLMPCSTSISFSPCVNGANRWLYLNPSPLPAVPFLGVLGFQPGELAKLSVILYLSSQLSLIMQKDKSAKDKKPFETYLKITTLLAGLIIFQPNMSTAAMVFTLGTVVYFVSGAPLKPVLITIPIFLLLAVLVIVSSPYRMSRLKALMSGDEEGSESSYHVKQALVALGSGGFFGVGFGQSKQKYQYLPEVASDSIFAIIGEEFGFIGTVLVISAYGYFIYKGFRIAKKSEDLFGKLVSIGISSWLGIQFFINIASMTKLIPMTGVPIPLISYGGSSMLFSLIGLGILANIQKNSVLE